MYSPKVDTGSNKEISRNRWKLYGFTSHPTPPHLLPGTTWQPLSGQVGISSSKEMRQFCKVVFLLVCLYIFSLVHGLRCFSRNKSSRRKGSRDSILPGTESNQSELLSGRQEPYCLFYAFPFYLKLAS